MTAGRVFYIVTTGGYFSTFALLVAWYGWLAPSVHLPKSLVLLLLVTPLLLPLRGILHARRYTIAWSCFLALLYFTHAVLEAWVPGPARHLALGELLFTVCWFSGGILYVRTTPRQTGAPAG